MDLTDDPSMDDSRRAPRKARASASAAEKSDTAYRTIGEVAELIDVPAHVLRFWEGKFSQVRPMKRAGGRRYYRPVDVALLSGIRKLLHDDGMAIRGVQRLLREQGVEAISAAGLPDSGAAAVPKPVLTVVVTPPEAAPAGDPDLLSLMQSPAAVPPMAVAPQGFAVPDLPVIDEDPAVPTPIAALLRRAGPADAADLPRLGALAARLSALRARLA